LGTAIATVTTMNKMVVIRLSSAMKPARSFSVAAPR
jgi:hypothetical protein